MCFNRTSLQPVSPSSNTSLHPLSGSMPPSPTVPPILAPNCTASACLSPYRCVFSFLAPGQPGLDHSPHRWPTLSQLGPQPCAFHTATPPPAVGAQYLHPGVTSDRQEQIRGQCGEQILRGNRLQSHLGPGAPFTQCGKSRAGAGSRGRLGTALKLGCTAVVGPGPQHPSIGGGWRHPESRLSLRA